LAAAGHVLVAYAMRYDSRPLLT